MKGVKSVTYLRTGPGAAGPQPAWASGTGWTAAAWLLAARVPQVCSVRKSCKNGLARKNPGCAQGRDSFVPRVACSPCLRGTPRNSASRKVGDHAMSAEICVNVETNRTVLITLHDRTTGKRRTRDLPAAVRRLRLRRAVATTNSPAARPARRRAGNGRFATATTIGLERNPLAVNERVRRIFRRRQRAKQEASTP